MAVRDLSEKEMDEAVLLADHLWRKQGPNEFVMTCKSLAISRHLSRAQFEAMKRAMEAKNEHDSWERQRPRIQLGKSRRPITLPKI